METQGPDIRGVVRRIVEGGVWNMKAEERTTLDEVSKDLANGSCALFLPGSKGTVTFTVPTEKQQRISAPEIENVLKGPKDACVFVFYCAAGLKLRRSYRSVPPLTAQSHWRWRCGQ